MNIAEDLHLLSDGCFLQLTPQSSVIPIHSNSQEII